MILGLISNVEGKNHIFPNHPSYNGADRPILTKSQKVK